MERKLINKITFLFFSCMVMVCYQLIRPMEVNAQEMVSRHALEQAVELRLHSRNTKENVPFQLTNMFPGDSTTQNYRLSVSYTGTITVCFQVAVAGGDKKLSGALEIIVQLSDTGELLYKGLLADMPILVRELSTDSKSKTEELAYEITVGLSTRVGNEYQDKKLTADLSWWAEGEEPTEPSEPESGEDWTQPDELGSEDEEEDAASTGGSLTNPPTGDESRIFMWLLIMSVSVAVMILVFAGYRRSRLVMSDMSALGHKRKGGNVAVSGEAGVEKTRRQLFLGIFLTVFLVLMLGIVSSALIWQKISVEKSLFQTGIVSISLNDDQPIFKEDMLFEPGMVVKKDFTLRNDSTCDVHYRLYLTNVDGDMAEAVQVQVLHKDTAIFEGTMADMNGKKSEGADGFLQEGEERVMTVVFRVPQDCGNVMQGGTIEFDLNAEAVQTVNNPDGLFE